MNQVRVDGQGLTMVAMMISQFAEISDTKAAKKTAAAGEFASRGRIDACGFLFSRIRVSAAIAAKIKGNAKQLARGECPRQPDTMRYIQSLRLSLAN